MNHGSLFSGIGGFDLASEWAGWNNMFHCEWNEFGRKVLNYYWPNAKSYEDITKSDFTVWRGRIDILTGGFPCQGFSLAGLRKGTEDHRFLWPEMRRAYNESKPPWVVCENVTGLLTMEDKRSVSKDVFFKVENQTVTRLLEADLYNAVYTRQSKMLIESICQDFEEDGYEVYPFVIPAASVEAPHKRERVWLIAYSADARAENVQYRRENGIREPGSTAYSKSKSGFASAAQINEREKYKPEHREGIRDSSITNGREWTTPNTNGNGCKSNNESKEGQQYDGRGPTRSKFGPFDGGRIIADTNSPRPQNGQLDGSEVQGGNREGGDSSDNNTKAKKCVDASNTGGKQLQVRTPERDCKNKEEKETGLDNRTERSGNLGDAPDPTSKRQRGESNGIEEARLFDQESQEPNWQNFPTQSPICSGDDGLSGRLDGITFPKWRAESIKAYGNAIVPQVAYEIFKVINQM